MNKVYVCYECEVYNNEVFTTNKKVVDSLEKAEQWKADITATNNLWRDYEEFSIE